jgi:hypothetical protein
MLGIILAFFLVVNFLQVSCHVIQESNEFSRENNEDPETLLKQVNMHENDVNHHMTRNLQVLTFTCPGGGPQHFFTISIGLTPQGGFDTSKCTDTLKKNIGIDLNNLLYNYGLGPAGVGDNAAYAAVVCTKPVSARRRLQTINFVWKGGGTCRQCSSDNFDRRRRLYDPNWFKNIYVPEMQNTLRNAITNTVAPKHVTCLGNGPRVDVYVIEVSSSSSVPTTCP